MGLRMTWQSRRIRGTPWDGVTWDQVIGQVIGQVIWKRGKWVKIKIRAQDRNMTPFLESCCHATSKMVEVLVIWRGGNT